MSDVVTGEGVTLNVRAARLPTRTVAVFLDMLAQVALLAGCLWLTSQVASVTDSALGRAIQIVVLVLVVVGYPTTLETLWRGKSLGKAALGLRVVSNDGGPERFRQALLRAFASLIEIWLAPLAVALVLAGMGRPSLLALALTLPATFAFSLFSREGKRPGDVFAGTLVMRERMPVRGGPVAAMPPPLAAWAASLELSGLSSETALSVRQFLSRYRELHPAARQQMAQQLATAVAAQVNPPPPAGTPADVYLSAVLAERRRREEARFAAPPVHAASPPHAAPLAHGTKPADGQVSPYGHSGSNGNEKGARQAGGFVPPS